MSYKVEFLEPAADDLLTLHAWIEGEAGPHVADVYLARLKEHCFKLAEFPRRGTPRDDLMSGARSLSFERRILIFYRVEDRTVQIMHVVSTFRETPILN